MAWPRCDTRGRWPAWREARGRLAAAGINAAAHKNVEYLHRVGQSGAMSSSRIVLEAIARRRCLEATSNRMTVRLAPHLLYPPHDDLFVAAVTVERAGRPPRERKLGTFKLAGL